VDVSNPSAPVHKGSIANGTGGALLNAARSVFVSGNYAYITANNSNALEIVDVSGATISNFAAGTAKINNLSVDAFAQFNQSVLVNSGLNVGGNALVNGALTVSGNLGSTTAGTPILTTGTADTNTSGISDILNIFHTSTSTNSTSASGIGASILFSLQDASTNSSGVGLNTATSTARIASILTNTSTTSPASVLTFSTKNTTGALTEWMRLDQNGNVGIGTTSPKATLSVNAASGATSFAIGSSSSSYFLVDKNGNVGIGTSSPVTKLGVTGDTYITGGLGVGTRNTTAGTLTTSGDATIGGSTGLTVSTGNVAVNTNKGLTTGGALVFSLVDTHTVSIDAGGTNINITGNYAGSGELPSGTLYDVNNANLSLLADNSNTAKTTIGYGVNSNTTLYSALEVANVTSGFSNLLLMKSGGNVGIGTTSPWALLSINATSSSAAFAIGSSTATKFIVDKNGNVGVGTTSPSQLFSVGTVGSNSAYFAGNVGIGINAPTTKLQFGAATNAAGGIKFGTDINLFRSNDADGLSTIQLRTTNDFGIDGNLYFGNSTAVNHIYPYYQQGLTIGPDDTDAWQPNASKTLLSVDTNTGGSVPGLASNLVVFRTQGLLNNNGSTGTITGSWTAAEIDNIFGDGGASPKITYNGNQPLYGLFIKPKIDVATASTKGYTALAVNPTETSTSTAAGVVNYIVDFQVGSSTKFNVTDTGNVGISTSSPASTLTVVGSACISGGAGATAACTTTAGHISAVSHDTAAVDVAENYNTHDQTIVAGDIVAIDSANDNSIIKATSTTNIIGIVSTQPGVLLGFDENDKTLRAVALAGRVPVKISSENGAIHRGDSLGVSKTNPGVAVKTSGYSGNTIGTALTEPVGNTVTVFIKPGFTQGVPLNVSDELVKDDSSLWSDFNALMSGATDWMQARVVAVNGFFKNIFADRVTTKTLCLGNATDTVCVTKDQLKSLLNQANVSAAPIIPPSGGVLITPSSSSTPVTITDVASSTATTTPPVIPMIPTTPATSTPVTIIDVATSTPSNFVAPVDSNSSVITIPDASSVSTSSPQATTP
jgi:hypothetical protein